MITRSSGVRSVAAAAFAAVAVFVLIGNDQPADGDQATVPATVLASGGGADGGSDGGSDGGADEKPPDREAVLEAVRGLLTALDLQPEDLLEDAEQGGDDGKGEDGKDGEEDGQEDGKDTGHGADCPSRTECPASGTTETTETITIREYAFGAELTVAPGTPVKVVNGDTVPHNLTADDGGFATGNLEPNATATVTAPREPGRYTFNCTLHRGMAGALVVADGNGAGMDEHKGSGSR